MKHLFWVKEGLRITAATFAGAAVYTLLMRLQSSGDEIFADYLDMGLIYLTVMGAIMALIFSLGLHQILIPLTISFGAERREVIAGIQLYRLTVVLPVLLVSGVLAAVTSVVEPGDLWIFLVLEISAFLFFNALGGLMGTLTGKLSTGLITGISIALVLIGVILMGLVVVLGVVYLELSQWIIWIIFSICALTYAICSIFEWRAIRRCCVR